MVLDASRIKGRWQDDYFLRTGHLATLKGDNMEIKNVQIPFALFRQLVSYHLMEDQSCSEEICKPLFIQMKNKIAAMAAQVKELTKEVEKWKNKYQKTKQAYNSVQKELDDMRKDNQKLLEEKNMLQSVSDRYDRVVRVMGIDTVEAAVLQDIHNQKALEEKRRMEQMPKGSIYERLAWGAKKSEMENQQRKKNKTKNRGMEI